MNSKIDKLIEHVNVVTIIDSCVNKLYKIKMYLLFEIVRDFFQARQIDKDPCKV